MVYIICSIIWAIDIFFYSNTEIFSIFSIFFSFFVVGYLVFFKYYFTIMREIVYSIRSLYEDLISIRYGFRTLRSLNSRIDFTSVRSTKLFGGFNKRGRILGRRRIPAFFFRKVEYFVSRSVRRKFVSQVLFKVSSFYYQILMYALLYQFRQENYGSVNCFINHFEAENIYSVSTVEVLDMSRLGSSNFFYLSFSMPSTDFFYYLDSTSDINELVFERLYLKSLNRIIVVLHLSSIIYIFLCIIVN